MLVWSRFNPGVDSILVYGFNTGVVRIRSLCVPDLILVWSGFNPGVVLVEHWLDPSSFLVPVWFSLFNVILNLLCILILF